jgi:hypothetical protein
VKDLVRACLTRRVEFVPPGAIDERRRAKIARALSIGNLGLAFRARFASLFRPLARSFVRFIESRLLTPRAVPWSNI